MAPEHDDELRALRARAYGRDADIHLDPMAVERLRELEEEGHDHGPADVDKQLEQEDGFVEWFGFDGNDDEADPEADPDPDVDTVEGPTRDWFGPLSRIPRSVLLVTIGVVIVGMIIAVSPALLDRVQTDPLQVDADQVTRLSLDSGYVIPEVFSGNSNGSSGTLESQAFQSFRGLRVVKVDNKILGAAANNTCLVVFVELDNAEVASGQSFGPSFFGCSAGKFPAIVQFTTDSQQLADKLSLGLPPNTALQFVHDSAHDEVVVFMLQGDSE